MRARALDRPEMATLAAVKTVVLDPLPVEVERLIERRKRLGLDAYDEVWEGTYHMAPMARFRHGWLDQQLAELLGPPARRAGLVMSGPFNIGAPDDFRVPDRGVHRGRPDPEAAYLATAAMVIEIVSPGDETYDKLPFYAGRGVDEVLVVDPGLERVRLLARAGDGYDDAGESTVLGVDVVELQGAIRWP